MTNEQFHLRPYVPTDHDPVVFLHRVALEKVGAAYPAGTWDSDLHEIEKIYIASGGTFLIGCIKDKVVAMGAFKPVTNSTVEIKRMRVLPELQRQGLGQIILGTLEREALQKGYNRFVLDTTVRQIAAQQLYIKNGYRETHRTTEGFPLETIFFEKVVS